MVLVPPGDEPGEVDVTVETEDWLSAVKTSDQYLYVRTAGEEEEGGGGGGPKNKGGHGKGNNNNEVPLELILQPAETAHHDNHQRHGQYLRKQNGRDALVRRLAAQQQDLGRHPRPRDDLARVSRRRQLRRAPNPAGERQEGQAHADQDDRLGDATSPPPGAPLDRR